jgi:SagB-type dehydrogenase family enzyme
MSINSFLYNLHYDIEKASPSDWTVDWEDAPLTYKLYKDLSLIPLSLNVPLRLEGHDTQMKPDLLKIGHFLWYVYGITQICQSVVPSESDEVGLMQSNRRFIPSGGALYPNELYIYLNMEEVSPGIYHYDVARHSLVLLREGNFDSFLSRALGKRCDVSNCFATVFVSTMFWKNFFKYNNFSYRLQGLDAGVLIGQLLEMCKRFGYSSEVFFQFIDRSLNHLLGISEEEESIYGVIPLSFIDSSFTSKNDNENSINTSTELNKELPKIQHNHFVKSKKVLSYPMLVNLNKKSMIESSRFFRYLEEKEITAPTKEVIYLPKVKRINYDLASICKQRFSPDMDFVLGKVSQIKLATLLYEASSSFFYQNDLDEPNKKNKQRLSLYCCLYDVEGIPNGAYFYDYTSQSLRQVQSGDFRLKLQYGMSGTNVNLLQIPICLHVVGDKDHLTSALGYRGYRIQQLEAGMMVQRLLLTATALGLGGHPLLGYDVSLCDEIYQLDSLQKTSLIQIPIGNYRDRPCLQGGLHT